MVITTKGFILYLFKDYLSQRYYIKENFKSIKILIIKNSTIIIIIIIIITTTRTITANSLN